MGKLLVLAVILLQFAGLTDDVCALCVPWVHADGLAAVGDEMLSDNQGRPARAKVAVLPPDRAAEKPPVGPLEIHRAAATDPGGLRATDPIYSYMSLQR
jgi:hypothetical protein